MYMHMSVLLDKMFTRMGNLKTHETTTLCREVVTRGVARTFYLVGQTV